MFGYRDTKTEKQNIESKQPFRIQEDSIRLKFEKLIDSIQTRGLVHTNRGFDLYHIVVDIDGKKYVDRFGDDSLVTRLSLVLLPYVQINHKARECDYLFNLNRIFYDQTDSTNNSK